MSVPHEAGQLSAGAHTVHFPRSLTGLKIPFGGSGGSHLLKVKKRSATYEGIEEDERALGLGSPGLNASVGLLAVIGLCITSGLGGVYFEKVVKDSPKPTSLWIRNVQLAIYSIFPSLFIGVMFIDGETVARDGFFAGYDQVVVATICLQTFGGIVAAFTIYYADNVSKNFAISISLVISSLVSFFFFDFEATGNVSSHLSACSRLSCTNHISAVPLWHIDRPLCNISLQWQRSPPETTTHAIT